MDYVMLGIGAVLFILAFFWHRSVVKEMEKSQEQPKSLKKKKTISLLLEVVGIWVALTCATTIIFGAHPSQEFTVELFAERTELFGMSVSTTVIITWIAMAVLIVLALILRFTVIAHMKDVPGKVQNVLEIMIESISDYTESRTPHLGDTLPAYLFSLAALMIACAAVELFGYRAPTADITMTFAMALVTFFLINYYGIKCKGVGGRLKSYAEPTPIVFPMKIVSDLAVPVSLACRLFGNMLGGMIVMELLYYALGNAGFFAPPIAGLYFNVFHPLIQAFIFVTLSLTFINEAAEIAED